MSGGLLKTTVTNIITHFNWYTIQVIYHAPKTNRSTLTQIDTVKMLESEGNANF